MSEVIVGCRGKTPNRVAIVGERPGATEASTRRPFAGPSGVEQDRYLTTYGGRHSSQYFVTNLCKSYDPNNTDPSPADIARWTPTLLAEIAQCQPEFILAIGRYAVRWFLGDDADMERVHGIPHRAGAFDSTRANRAHGAIVLPCYHPAYGLHDNEARTLIAYDYERAMAAVNGKIACDPVEDTHAGSEVYEDVTGADLARAIREAGDVDAFGIDTEGYADDPWSVQISLGSGTGLTLRCSQSNFAIGAAAISALSARPGVTTVIHNAMYDLEMCDVMGASLRDATLWDSMYAAYITRIEPQGLKPLAYRWCGMKMRSHNETVGEAGLEKQLAYLGRVLELPWSKPEPRLEQSNDGTARVYTPQPVERRAEAILVDHYSDKRDKKGEPIDVEKRWHQVDRDLRRMVEAVIGPMPRPSLADIPLRDAVHYASRDPDATLRLYYALHPELARQNLTQLMTDGMNVLPIFEEMQRNGMLADRDHFARLSVAMWDKMCSIQYHISTVYCDGEPFNPASSDQVADLMQRRGIRGVKWTETGKVSTGKKSIEHLRYSDDAIGNVIDWREHQKTRDSFAEPILDVIPEGVKVHPIRTTIKITRVATRRISTSGIPLLAIPVRNDLGAQVRAGFVVPEGELFGSWDLSAAEMRVMAGLSRDPLLVRMFKEKRDPHAETAARIFGIKLADVDEMKHRYPAKRAGFGVITNIKGAGLYDQLRMFGCEGWSIERCDELIREWLKVYKGVHAFLDECAAEARKKGVVYDYWGMPRHLPGVWSSNRKIAADDERAASSHLIQGGAQGMIQRSMAYAKSYIRALQQAELNVKWILQQHDSLILSFSEDLWDTVDPLIVDALTNHHDMDLGGVPMVAKGSKARTWAGLKYATR